jgi:3-deoxy-D-manno-octulosonate 8-phosphate phosphatase (KDO 8-P phosphatase)
MPASPELLKRIKLLVLDVDGTLTDGRLFYGHDGEVMKAFDVRDGHGLRLLSMYRGVKLAVLTGRRADIVALRCRELCIDPVVGNSRDKAKSLREMVAKLGIPLEQTAYMGDDMNDLAALKLAGLSACPSDAVPEVLSFCAFVADRPGGRGAVRALCESILGATVGWPVPEGSPVVEELPPKDAKTA